MVITSRLEETTRQWTALGSGRTGWRGVGSHCGILLNLTEDHLRIVLKYKEKMANGTTTLALDYAITSAKIDISITIVISMHSSKCHAHILLN